MRYGTWLLIDSPKLAVRGAQDQMMLYLVGCFLVSLSHTLTALRGLFWLVFIPEWVFSFNRTEALRYSTWLNFGSSLRVEQSITNQSNKARFLWPVPSVRQGIHMNPSSTESKVVGILTTVVTDYYCCKYFENKSICTQTPAWWAEASSWSLFPLVEHLHAPSPLKATL